MLGLSHRVMMRFSKGPAGLEPPSGARIRKNKRGELFVLQDHTEEGTKLCLEVLTVHINKLLLAQT